MHVYDVVDVESLLECALSNFREVSRHAAQAENEFVLVVTEGVNEGAAERLRALQSQQWKVEQGDEVSLLIVSNVESGQRLLVVLAQQLVSEEGVEVLAVGVDRQDYQPRKPLETLLNDLGHGLTILPWGVGKWLGGRGKQINEVFKRYQGDAPIFVGDIPARVGVFGGGAQIKLSHQVGLSTLRGADNLPLKGDEVRVGKFCTKLVVCAESFKRSPLASILKTLKDKPSTAEVEQFGEFQSFASIVKSQLQLRI